MLQTIKYLQIISFFGVILLVSYFLIFEVFLAIVSSFNAEFLKIPNGKSGQASFSLWISAIFYLLVFIGTTVYVGKNRVLGTKGKIHDKMVSYGYDPMEQRNGKIKII